MYPPVYPFLIQFLGTSFDQDLLSSASKEGAPPKRDLSLNQKLGHEEEVESTKEALGRSQFTYPAKNVCAKRHVGLAPQWIHILPTCNDLISATLGASLNPCGLDPSKNCCCCDDDTRFSGIEEAAYITFWSTSIMYGHRCRLWCWWQHSAHDACDWTWVRKPISTSCQCCE